MRTTYGWVDIDPTIVVHRVMPDVDPEIEQCGVVYGYRDSCTMRTTTAAWLPNVAENPKESFKFKTSDMSEQEHYRVFAQAAHSVVVGSWHTHYDSETSYPSIYDLQDCKRGYFGCVYCPASRMFSVYDTYGILGSYELTEGDLS